MMNQTNWERLSQVNTYLSERVARGTQAFQALLQRAEQDKASWVTISFTYEHLEAYAKIGEQIQLYDNLMGTINHYELDDFTSHEYNEKLASESYQYNGLEHCAVQLLKMWVMHCFSAAQAVQATKIPFYFKYNHDDLEVLTLQSGEIQFEQSEFETYVKNNRHNVITLLGQT